MENSISQISSHSRTISLACLGSPNVHLFNRYFAFSVLWQTYFTTSTTQQWWNREHVLVCFWNFYQLFYVCGEKFLEQNYEDYNTIADW